MTTSPPLFTPEGGRFYLAEALFAAYAYRIRCPACPGNPHRPGFIKDSAGKSTGDGLSRRQWKCQRTNGRATTGKDCPRVTCTQYIEIATHILSAEELEGIVTTVLAQPNLTSTEKLLVQNYFSPRPQKSPINRKRKVEDEGEQQKTATKILRHDSSTPVTTTPSPGEFTSAAVDILPITRSTSVAPSSPPARLDTGLVKSINDRIAKVLPVTTYLDDISQIPTYVSAYVNIIEAIVFDLHQALPKTRRPSVTHSTGSVTVPKPPQISPNRTGSTPPSSIPETGLVESLVLDFLFHSPTSVARTEVRRRAKALGLAKEFQNVLANHR